MIRSSSSRVWGSFVKAATKQLQQDVRCITQVGDTVHLNFLEACILRVLDDVIHQHLNHKSASLVSAASKCNRRAAILEEECKPKPPKGEYRVHMEPWEWLREKQMERMERLEDASRASRKTSRASRRKGDQW